MIGEFICHSVRNRRAIFTSCLFRFSFLKHLLLYLQVLLDYGEYNEQGDVSYTIANLEGSILFILGLEVSPQALLAWEHSTYANNNNAFSMANRNHRGVSSSRDIKSKYSSDKLNELVRQGTHSTSTNVSSTATGTGSNEQTTVHAGNNNLNASGNNANTYAHSASTPAFTEMSFAAKTKDDHNDDDVQAMKQLGSSSFCCCYTSMIVYIVFYFVQSREKYLHLPAFYCFFVVFERR